MPNILIAERDPVTARALDFKLRKQEGFSCDIASRGEEALRLIKEKKPDIILLTILLKGEDGWSVLEKKMKDPEVKDIPTIIITNLGGEQEAEKAKRMGATDYVIKADLNIHQLVELVKKRLGTEP